MHIFGIYEQCDLNGTSELNDFIDPVEYIIGGGRKEETYQSLRN